MIYDKKSFLPGNIEDLFFYQKVFDALPIPIFYRDLQGVYQMCNKAHEEFSGRPRAQIIGHSVYDVHTKHMAEIYFQRDQELFANPDIQIYETQVRQQDGSRLDVVINKAVIRSNEGEIVGFVGSINDVTKLKKTEKRLEKAQESMEVSSHMLHKINVGILLMDEHLKVIDSNKSFARLMGEDTEELFETIAGLKGAEVAELVPEVIFKMLTSILTSGEELLERDIKYSDRLLHVTVVTLYRNKVVGAVIRDMSAPLLVRDEIINRAYRIKKQNIDTVQKIAFLLGENAAETEELLNSIIESYRYGSDK
jgi:PAS domain S-box-containing protein